VTDTPVTIADLGTSIATNGTLTSVTLVSPPRASDDHYFTLTDTAPTGTEVTLFNIQTGSQPFATGTVFRLYDHSFSNLVLSSISPDSKFVITTNSTGEQLRASPSSHGERTHHSRRASHG
jgi:hypothetical protein